MSTGTRREMVFCFGVLAAAVVLSFAGVEVYGADASQAYVKKATWAQTVIATRDNYSASEENAPIKLNGWYCTSAIPAKDFSDSFLDFSKSVNLKAKDKDGKRIWSPKRYADGRVHRLPGLDGASTYLCRTITAEKATTVSTGMGSDDGIEVWLNGGKIHSNDVPRGPGPDQDRVNLELKAGANELVMKIYNRTGDHGFYFSAGANPVLELWRNFERDFPLESSYLKNDMPEGGYLDFVTDKDSVELEKALVRGALKDIGGFGKEIASEYESIAREQGVADEGRLLGLYAEACGLRVNIGSLKGVNVVAIRRAIEDLVHTYGDKYPGGSEYMARLDGIEKKLAGGGGDNIDLVKEAVDLQRDALLANPLLDFERLLLVKRKANNMGLPQNWQGNCSIGKGGYDNEIAVMPVMPGGNLTTLFKPANGEFVGDVDLNFDADKMLFSMPGGSNNRWHIWEIKADGTGLRQVTGDKNPEVDNYDACYLADGRIVFASTACFAGVPCVGGSDSVANLFQMEADGSNIRQLCFDQDHNWGPAMLNNGRVLYTRWEYSDTPHYFSRLLFSMNPDGTNQVEYYGSNSYWPNSMFYARAIPNDPTKVVAIVSGHHGVARMGELLIFDPAKGRHEADGVVQRIPGYGEKVEPVIVDQLVNSSWPKFLHPYPLSEKYFLVSCQPTAESNWGIYLVDVFDNMVLLKEEPGYAMLEPVPFRKTPRPPVVPDRVDLRQKEALVYLVDIYQGQGMQGVPKGTVKKLRVYEFHFGYPRMGGHKSIGVEGPWDVHRIIGTVPVYEDGSAFFRAPANTPIAVQPLDSEGRAVQLMRSWFTAMPGESVSCVGCHERQNTTAAARQTIAALKEPVEITPWYGPTRGFSFSREVQPVLDKYCAGCHNAKGDSAVASKPDFSAKDRNGWGNFTPSYLALHPYVRRPGPESDYHVNSPYEYYAGTSELVQMLEKGHYNVEMDAEAWDRLCTWIDLNVPDHGTWAENSRVADDFDKKRLEMRRLYADRPEDPEAIASIESKPVEFVRPKPMASLATSQITCANWPFDEAKAKAMQQAAGPATKTVDLGDGVEMEMVRIPAGEFVMGSLEGARDEMPEGTVTIAKPFWMGVLEVTNSQYNRFDPGHTNGYIDQQHKDHTTPGYPAFDPDMPAMRISWSEAMAFCEWLGGKTGMKVGLPTEAQWEWACRAGTETPFSYGGFDADFGTHANLADYSITLLAVTGVNPQPIANPSPYEDFIPKDGRFNDNARIMTRTGQYSASVWGLKDMHGNVWEWTLSKYAAYPYGDNDGRNDPAGAEKRVVRGGSWYDRPARATSSYRLSYEPYQKVFNVGFRVVCQ